MAVSKTMILDKIQTAKKTRPKMILSGPGQKCSPVDHWMVPYILPNSGQADYTCIKIL